MSEHRVLLIACGIFAREFSLLEPSLQDAFEPRFVDSMLHMRPTLLEERLSSMVADLGDRPRVFLYGDCCPRMAEFAGEPGARRSCGINCIEIALGSARYRELRRAGAFFFMPEWLNRWEEVFEHELGFSDPALALKFMSESASRVVYVDTGARPVPEKELARVGKYFGLPVLVEKAGLDGLATALERALRGLE